MAKHQPPSRIRYFEDHPQVNIRLPLQLRDDIHTYAKAHGLSLGVLVSRLFKHHKKPLADFREGYQLGYASAIANERLEVNCSYCGRSIQVSQRQVVELAERLLRFKHKECPCGGEIEINRR